MYGYGDDNQVFERIIYYSVHCLLRTVGIGRLYLCEEVHKSYFFSEYLVPVQF